MVDDFMNSGIHHAFSSLVERRAGPEVFGRTGYSLDLLMSCHRTDECETYWRWSTSLKRVKDWRRVGKIGHQGESRESVSRSGSKTETETVSGTGYSGSLPIVLFCFSANGLRVLSIIKYLMPNQLS